MRIQTTGQHSMKEPDLYNSVLPASAQSLWEVQIFRYCQGQFQDGTQNSTLTVFLFVFLFLQFLPLILILKTFKLLKNWKDGTMTTHVYLVYIDQLLTVVTVALSRSLPPPTPLFPLKVSCGHHHLFLPLNTWVHIC